VRFVGRLSGDPLGSILRNHARRSGLDLSLCVDAPEPTTVALVELDEEGAAQYRFGTQGTADFAWTAAELRRVPDDVAAVHFGSLASWLPPGAAAVAARIAELRAAGVTVTYDPNVRPRLQPDAEAARVAVEAAVRLADVVKASEDDLAHLRPGVPAEDAASDWLQLGPRAVVVTKGRHGSVAVTHDGLVARPPQPARVVDTVGAGDAFMSGLLAAIQGRGLLHEISEIPWSEVLDDAGVVAAITCSRAGANPPRRSELA
jgi:fructokinase